MAETKTKPKKKNTTVWLNADAITVFEKFAKEHRRSKNYVLARILEGIAKMPTMDFIDLMAKLNCKELL